MTIIGLSDFLVEIGELGLDWTGTELNDAFGFGTNPFLVLRGKVVIDNWFWFWWLWWAKMEGFCLWRVLGVKKSEGLRPISTCFGRQLIRPDFGQISLVRHELIWVGANPWKKKTQMQHRRVGSHVGGRTPHQAASNSGAAPSQPHQCFLSLKFWRSFIVFAWFLHYMMFCVVNLSLMFFL